MDAIQLSNLTKYYGKSRGILNLNLDIKEGEFFGFIGPNGAGKSNNPYAAQSDYPLIRSGENLRDGSESAQFQNPFPHRIPAV